MLKITATSALSLLLMSGVLADAKGHKTWTMTRVLESGTLVGLTNSERFLGVLRLPTWPFFQAFVWHHGDFVYLPQLFQPTDINESGQVVGMLGADTPALWDRGILVNLALAQGFTSGNVTAINNRGQAVGIVGGPSDSGPVLWDNGSMVRLPKFDPRYDAVATDINDRGQIVGEATDVSDNVEYSYAVLWEGGEIKRLEPLPGARSSGAAAINNRGQVVGRSRGADNVTRAVLWDNGIPIVLVPFPISSAAWAINERGQVVGTAWEETPDGYWDRPWVWERGVLTELPSNPPPGGERMGGANPVGINNRGHVIGNAAAGGGVLWTR